MDSIRRADEKRRTFSSNAVVIANNDNSNNNNRLALFPKRFWCSNNDQMNTTCCCKNWTQKYVGRKVQQGNYCCFIGYLKWFVCVFSRLVAPVSVVLIDVFVLHLFFYPRTRLAVRKLRKQVCLPLLSSLVHATNSVRLNTIRSLFDYKPSN